MMNEEEFDRRLDDFKSHYEIKFEKLQREQSIFEHQAKQQQEKIDSMIQEIVKLTTDFQQLIEEKNKEIESINEMRVSLESQISFMNDIKVSKDQEIKSLVSQLSDSNEQLIRNKEELKIVENKLTDVESSATNLIKSKEEELVALHTKLMDIDTSTVDILNKKDNEIAILQDMLQNDASTIANLSAENVELKKTVSETAHYHDINERLERVVTGLRAKLRFR